MGGGSGALDREGRLASVDQCRGFALLAMLFGNFMGKYSFMPWALTHHPHGFSLNETIAPLFFFLVGMSYRGAFLRRMAVDGAGGARRYALRRYLLIFGVGLVVYLDHFWDALTHIGMGGLICLPFMHRGARGRLFAAAGFLVLYQALFMTTGYGEWVMARPLNGGPLGALSWAAIIMAGTIVWDMLSVLPKNRAPQVFLFFGLLLIGAGWLLSLGWGGWKEPWPFTRYGMTAPLPVAATGIAVIVYDFFLVRCDGQGFRFPLLSPLGRNALLLYAVMGGFVGLERCMTRFLGEPSPAAAFGLLLGAAALLCAAAVFLDRKNILFRF